MKPNPEMKSRLQYVNDSDPVNHPSHYNSHPSGIEAIQITEHETFLRGNILKYVLRAPYKGNELEDLEKAAWYLQREIQRVRNHPNDDLVRPEDFGF